MAAGDEWIHVPSLQEEVKEAAAAEAETAAEVSAATAAGEDKPSENTSGGGAADAEENNNEAGTADAAATTDEARSDVESYGSTEVDDYLDGIEEEEEPKDEAATGDAVAAAEEALSALNIDEAAGAAAEGRGGKEMVMENPFYDDYYDGAEAAYYGGGYGYYGGYGSFFLGPGSYLGSGSGSTSRGYDDRYGAADGYNRYGYAGDAYGFEPAYGYGYYGYDGYAGYYGGSPYEPRYPSSVMYRAPPPAYGFMPSYPPLALYKEADLWALRCQYAAGLAPDCRHPQRAVEPTSTPAPGAGPSDAASRGLRRR